MANVKLVFLGTGKSESHEHELVVHVNQHNEIFIGIDCDTDSEYYKGWIALDKETAIKFSRELRKQISYMEREV